MATTEKQRDDEIEIDLVELFFYLVRHWKTILLGFIAGALIAFGYTQMKEATYESDAMLFVLSETTSITSVADLQIGSELSTDFVIVSTSKPVLDSVIEAVEEEMGITLTRSEVEEMYTVTNEEDTRILQFSAVTNDPELSYLVCKTASEAAATQMADIMQSDPPTTVESAEVPTEAVATSTTRTVGMGAIAGLVILAIIHIVRFLINDKIKSVEDIETYVEASVLGVIPVDKALVFNTGGKRGKKKRSKKKRSSQSSDKRRSA